MSRQDDLPYETIVERLKDQVERIAEDCIPDGRRAGNYWTGDCHGKCSVHIRGSNLGLVGFWQGQRPSAQGGNLIHLIEIAFGCSSHGAAVRMAKQRYLGIEDRPLTFEEKKDWARAQEESRRKRESRARTHQSEQEQKQARAKKIFHEALPIAGTLGETYLRQRGIDIPDIPKSLRFHPHLRYTLDVGAGARHFPAIVCGVQALDRKLIAIWQIFLDPETGGKAKLGEDESVKLGYGPAAGGAVRLGPLTDELNVCEGVETGFGVGGITGWKTPVWCLLSTSGMRGFDIPKGLKKLTIYEDGDSHRFNKTTGEMLGSPGKEAGKALRERAQAAGVPNIQNLSPPEPDDWLDVFTATKGFI